jgi:hypothetical protein
LILMIFQLKVDPHMLSNSEDIITLALLVPEIYHSKYFTFYAL